MSDFSDDELELIRATTARLRAGIFATVFAFAGGCGLFLATAWLLIRGGDPIGPHLGLLRYYFPGYTVTWPGSILGFFYGGLAGGLVGWSIALIYNRVRAWRMARVPTGADSRQAGTGP